MRDKIKITLLLAALALGGCSYAGDGLWPETADQAAEHASAAPAQASASALGAWTPALTAAEPLALDLPPKRDITPTDSFLGQKVAGLRSDLHMLIDIVSAQQEEYGDITGATAQLANRYQTTISRVRTRAGGTGAPTQANIVAQLDAAGKDLDAIDAAKPRLDDLAARVAANSGIATYVNAAATTAMGVNGGAEQDQAQLKQIVDDTNAVSAQNDRLLNAINATIANNQTQVAAERANLTTWSEAISQASVAASQPTVAAISTDGPALISIGFGRSRIEYEQALYDVVSATLNQSPEARFELVAVEPQRGGLGADLKQNTRRVFQSLMDMGLPSDRIILLSETSKAATAGEVQLYLR